ncbi:MAG: proline--tRNA ligase [Fuerstiella sp.]|nr:proline--tRNA ligase [Fuerstiella sp.]MCP4782877.1 proline--tRNA ligase [Fuerstiella sp.]MCP4857757.1 proline--tRNA ligase [Fuerstiella sp.]
MRWSQTFIPTMKEVPSDAEVPSHQLMLRAGLIRQLMAGAYTFMPLGYRVVRKVSQIVREEMDRAGGVELFMPAIQPMELFERTGRKEAFGNVLFNFEAKRGDRNLQFALGPTHEEVITDLISREIKSYKQLPITLYQIQTKFRNEERPRFGVLRTSEFLMKDAYSFGASMEQLNQAYDAMYNAYCRIFERCGLEYIPVEAESGPIGGDASHEFMAPADNGEDFVVRCSGCEYAANQERADTGRSSSIPARVDDAADPQKVDTPNAGTIEDVSRMLNADPSTFIKTLIYSVSSDASDTGSVEHHPPKAGYSVSGDSADANDDESNPPKAVAVLVRGDHEVNEGKVRRALGTSSLELADEATIERVTGAPTGFAGPVGIKCDYIADHDVAMVTSAITGANEKDAHLTGVIPGTHFELTETHDLRNAIADDSCPRCDGTLETVHGIEVGHVFKLGTKYSESLDAVFLDREEKKHPIIMGCYGIGVSRVVAAIVETCHDDGGIIWPKSVAPYTVELIPLNIKDEATMTAANKIYEELSAGGIDVLMDDRDQRPGFKFKDADLIGLPIRVIIGGKGLKEGNSEVKLRTESQATKVPIGETCEYVRRLVSAN